MVYIYILKIFNYSAQPFDRRHVKVNLGRHILKCIEDLCNSCAAAESFFLLVAERVSTNEICLHYLLKIQTFALLCLSLH